VLVSWNRNHRT